MRQSPSLKALIRSFEINVGDGFANGTLVQHGLLIDQLGHQSGGADLINATRNAFGVLNNALQRVVGEERASLVAGDLDLVLDVADRLLQVERAEVIQACAALGSQCPEAQDATTYFTNNAARMRYDQYRAANYLIGSGGPSRAAASKSSRTASSVQTRSGLSPAR